MSTKPNVIVLFSDQQRWDTVSCYGEPLGSQFNLTPNLDRLAAEGMRFEHAFTCQPVCGPARACLQTGKWATEVGCYQNHTMPPAEEMRLAPAFNAAGYQTAYIGKWHLASFGEHGGPDDFRTRPIPPERRGGYEYWLASDVLEFTSHGYDGHMFDGDGNKREFEPGRYRADAVGDWAVEFIENRDRERPFFLMVSWIEPHHQNDTDRYEGPRGSKEQFANFTTPGDLADTDGDWRETLADYLGCCRSLDENVGRIRAALEDQGIAEETVILYTSDHGSHFRTRNAEYKRSCHDGCIRIPMIAWGGAFRGQPPAGQLASLIDVPPTLLTAAGIDVPEAFRGWPLQQLVDGPARQWRDEVFLQVSEDHIGRAIRTPRWTYEVVADSTEEGRSGRGAPAAETYREAHFYDNDADPHQRNNLVADPAYADVRDELRRRLLARIEAAEGARPEIHIAQEPDG
ncbi:MAG: sulfatase-like hydrolase/transferase [Planctomycetes bacterium]|jgi:uncharacterized sulfatase|nr:sulfatase-like hydrolase/transferase [Phycisphaerae bacterium]NBB95380.1 sulfatase-like hydrolase/transferase [Planctomycetota bacterium]